MRKKLISLALTAVMLLSLAAPVSAAETAVCSAIVTFAEGADADAVCAALEALPGVTVRWQYRTLFDGAAIEGNAAALQRAADCGSVATLSLARTWALPMVEEGTLSNALDVMQGEALTERGDGMVIAVLDSGLYVTHEAFRDYGILEAPALSREEVEAFSDEGGTQGRYISQKIPFAYDYSDKDRSVHSADNHGTHVAGLAVGYAQREDGSVKFTGVAPAAQLLCMKVFPDDSSLGANDADILKAMEDALLLGADVVNLSLGTEGDFMQGGDTAALYQTAIAQLREAGVIVCCAAGNSADALYGKRDGILYPTADYTDYGAACLPAAYPGTVAVGAVNALRIDGEGTVVVDGTAISYVEGESEREEDILPGWESLAGQELPYVMVGGVGAKEEYEGLDLTGCVAVVARGEIYFSEKVQNAAAAGAAACLIYNNESGVIRPSVEGTTIPSALITQTAGAYLAECAKDGRGLLRVTARGEQIDTGEALSMLDASAWGATSDLRLVPTLSAPGGSVYSAVTGATDAYAYLSGTSMAAPNASGAFALLLEALTKRGVTDKGERATLAEDLLTSTAVLVTDEAGTPLSPRRQGAGVIDLTAALTSRAVVVNPILTLGDKLGRTLKLSFTVKNLSQDDLTFSVAGQLLTDALGTVEEQVYSTLAPQDITRNMTLSGGRTVFVRAGDEQTVNLTLTVDLSLIEAREKVCPNGFFLEGYVTLTEAAGEQIHATFMGYHGDWNAAPVVEQVDFRDLMDAQAAGESLPVNFWYNIPYLTGATQGNAQQRMLGENPWEDVNACDARLAMAAAGSDAHAIGGFAFTIDLYTLRNAAHVIMAVVDSDTGELYYVDDTSNLPRADFDLKTGTVIHTGLFLWDGTDSAGNALPDGTAVEVVFYAWTESDDVMQRAYAQTQSSMETPESYRWLLNGAYEDRVEWSFPLTLDGIAPTVTAQRDDTGDTIQLTVTEESFLAHAVVYDSRGEILYEESFAGDERGESHVLTIPCEAEDETLYVVLSDYASNTVGYCMTLTAEGADTTRCPMAIFSDVRKDAWYHEAVDFVYEEGLMDAEETLTFAPDHTALRASVIEALYRLAGMPEVTADTLPFQDLHGGEWYWDAVQWSYQQGIVNGYRADLFAAVAPVTRQQLAVMLYRAAALTGEVTVHDSAILDRFCDSGYIADWAQNAMVWAVGEGYLKGVSDGVLAPDATTTRAQLAQILQNIFTQE